MAVEFGLYVLMSRSAPTGFKSFDRLAQKIYWSQVNFIQYDPDCAQYHPKLTYTLRPGSCTFTNDGFSTRVDVNSVGLRDLEESLLAPEIIVVGDSHAMGWGVDSDETFSQLIQSSTGKTTLNAGISSYGTARELTMLKMLDLSGLRTLIVQYSDNDWWENRTYLESERNLPIQSAESYAKIVRANASIHYFPGAYFRAAFNVATNRLISAKENEPAFSAELTAGLSAADIFVRILASADLEGAQVHLLILEINTHGRGDGGFIDKVSQSNELDALEAAFDSITLINTHDFLFSEDRLFPDGHMSALGHQKVSKAVLDAIHEIERTSK